MNNEVAIPYQEGWFCGIVKKEKYMNSLQQKHTYHIQGFTLVELLIVVSVISLLASIILATAGSSRRSARDAVIKVNTRTLTQALQAYAIDQGDYPSIDVVNNDNGIADGGYDVCGFNSCGGSYGSLQPLLDKGYIPQAITTSTGGYGGIWYFHRIGPSAATFPSQRLMNYCTMGAICGFKDPTTTGNSCWANAGNNPDGTPATPAAQALILFWLESGPSSAYAHGDGSGFFSSVFAGANGICLN